MATIHEIDPNRRADVEAWLETFRQQNRGVAAGLWKLVGVKLINLGQVFQPDVPDDVAQGFKEATAAVGLSRIDLGIVAAIVNNEIVCPTLAAGPVGSRNWLGRFGAERSIAAPIAYGHQPVGTLAIAIGPGDPASVLKNVQTASQFWAPRLR